MVKRPFVLLTAVYLLGICMGRGISFMSCLPFLCLFLLCFLILYKICQRDRVWFFAPVFLVMGFFRVCQAAAPETVELLLFNETECRVSGTVTESSAGQYSGKMRIEKTRLYLADGESLENAGNIIAYVPNSLLVTPGSSIEISGTIRPLSKGDNPGQFNEYEYYKAQGICARVQSEDVKFIEFSGKKAAHIFWRWKQKLQQIFSEILPKQEAGILDAMLLAEKGMLGEEIKDLYQSSGISHILAVSGLHLSMLGLGVYKVLRKARAGANFSMAASAGFIVLYGCFTGFGVSVTRAVIMLLLSILSAGFGKTYDAPTALAAAAMAVLLPQPLQLFQAGFLMSFGAVAGILFFAPVFQKMGIKILGASLAVQLMLLPVFLWFYYEIPIYSILLNLLILPFLSLLLILAALAGAAGCLYIGLGRFLAGGVYLLLKGYELLCRFTAGLPNNRYCFGRPAVWQIFLYYLLLFFFYVLCRKFHKKRCFLFLLILCIFPCFSFSSRLTVTHLAVGQGDCAVIQSGRTTILMDAGSSYKNGAEKILIPYLQYQGDTRIEYVFLSHADSDHYSMLKEILNKMAEKNSEIQIDTLILSASAMQQENNKTIQELALKAGVECLFFSAGDSLQFKNMVLSCLYPGSTQGQIEDTNQSSLVMLLETKTSAFLFTGDIGAQEEALAVRELQKKNLDGKAVFLKTAHHGSKYSSTAEFLQYIKNGAAVISCGMGNRYGHPHKETLERLDMAEIPYFITWQSGAVQIIDGTGKISTWHNRE